MFFHNFRRRSALTLAGAAVLASLAACGEDSPIIVDPPALKDELFRTYVAMGNSITAGWQSSGILDSTQRESYAFYLAQQMGTTYEYQSLRAPGCPAPLTNLLTGTRVGGAAAGACLGIVPQARPTVNNVAVPDAFILDATNNNTAFTNPLTLLLSGGTSQVTRARAASPTFLSVWLGNNDVLYAATTGLLTAGTPAPGIASPGLTPTNTFTSRYQLMVDSIKQFPRLRGGVLVGVVDVTNIPLLFSGAALNLPQVKGAIDQVVGRSVAVVNCPATTPALISFRIVGLLRAVPADQTPTISCTKIPGQTLVGDAFVIDSTERATLSTAVAAYNTFIQQKATELNFAYVDPNPFLTDLRAQGQVPSFPNLANPSQPFGTYISVDGVHPARAAHKLVANAIIDAVNAKYGTSLADVTGN